MKNATTGLIALWVALFCLGTAFAKGEKSEEKSGAHLGVYAEEVTSDIAADYGAQVGKGVLVEDVVSESPADKAGLRSNDILMSLDGAPLTGPSELRVQIAKHKAGDTVALSYMRGGKERTVSVELSEREDEWFGSEIGAHAKAWGEQLKHEMGDKVHVMRSGDDEAFAGVVTQSLGEGLQNYFKVESGALISEVVEDSPAEEAGLKAGDVIVKIGERTVDDEGDVAKAIRKYEPGDEVDFEVMRDGKKVTLKVKLGDRDEHYGATPAPDGDMGALWHGTPAPDMQSFEYHFDMENLDEGLLELHEDLKDLDDIKMDLSIDPDVKVYRLNVDQATSIEDNGWWKRSWSDAKTKLDQEFQELKENFQRLKQELRALKDELKERMS